MLEIDEKAIKKVYFNASVQYHTDLIMSNVPLTNPYLERARELTQMSLKLRKKKRSSEHYFVSVSPRPEVTLDDLRVKVDKYVGRKMCVGTYYTYEWNKAGNPHVHILVKQLEYSDRDFRTNTTNTFKSLVGNLKCIDIRAIPEDWVEDKIQYIKGEKWDDHKKPLIDLDIKFREAHGLDQYYITGSFEEALLDGASQPCDDSDS